MRFSIIVANYNSGDLLKETLSPLVLSSFQDFEIIIADDGSSEPLEGLELWLRDNFTQVKLLKLDHTGMPGLVRNEAISAATGEYLVFQDSDDPIETNKLEAIDFYLLQKPDVKFLVHSAKLIDAVGDEVGERHVPNLPVGEFLMRLLCYGNFVPLSGLIVSRQILEKTGSFGRMRYSQDMDFIVKILSGISANCFGVMDRQLVRYRLHDASLTHGHTSLWSVKVDECWLFLSIFRTLVRVGRWKLVPVWFLVCGVGICFGQRSLIKKLLAKGLVRMLA